MFVEIDIHVSMKTTTDPIIARDGLLQSPWQENLTINVQTTTAGSMACDCLVVGGGITGMTAALFLQQSGKQTIIADAHSIGFGTTGGTSAHINTFADTNYSEAGKAFGEKGAQQFADAIKEGCKIIKQHVDVLMIDCDYEQKAGFIYAENDDEVKALEEIYQAALKVGVAVEYKEQAPTPVPYKKALCFYGQAQFHPLKYLKGLQQAYLEAGGKILENTLVEKVDSNDGAHLVTACERAINAKAVIYATHMPPNINVLNFECAPYRSYVLAVKLISGDYPDALIYDCQEPYHYVRSHRVDGEDLLLIGGCDHKTGHEDPENAFAELEKYARKYYDVASIKYRWSSQYYVPVDGLPYIGQMPMAADGVYCATGYNGNGMMLGSIAGKILSDLVSGKGSTYQELFKPSRIKPIDGFSEFVKENADVAYHFVADRFGIHESDSLKQVKPGTGELVEVDGKKIAAYRDEDGSMHALSPVCTHAACIVHWNAAERSWDCPCHGARYDIDGNVLTGPATRGLQRIPSSDE